MSHKHAYQRLSDDAVFCRDCGDIKRSEPPFCTLPHYPIYPYVPYVPTPVWPNWQPYVYPVWTVSSGTITTGSVVSDNQTLSFPDGSSVTYTAESLS